MPTSALPVCELSKLINSQFLAFFMEIFADFFFHQVSLCPLLPLKKDEKSIKVDQKMYLKIWKKGTNSMLLQTLT